MTAADEYQRVLGGHRLDVLGLATSCSCGGWHLMNAADSHRAHVSQALAVDPGVRAAVGREALERAAQVIEALRPDAAMMSPLSYRLARDDAAHIVRDLMPRNDGE